MGLIADEVVPEQPELEPVMLVSGLLLSGQPFAFNVRSGQGDVFEEGPDAIKYVSGLSGETVRIKDSAIASISIVTRQVPKLKPSKPFAPK